MSRPDPARTCRRMTWTLALFAISMAYIESAVVVYLRDQFYPDGFRFPVVVIPLPTYLIELGRELATLVMLFCVAWISGRERWERFLQFCFLFGLWDIFYYFWLKVFLGWPESFLTWDILFLIPLPWVGPVWAPLLISSTLVTGSWSLLRLQGKGVRIRFSRLAWAGVLLAGVLVLLSFFWNFRVVTEGGTPGGFPWILLAVGWIGGLTVFLVSVRNLPPGLGPEAGQEGD